MKINVKKIHMGQSPALILRQAGYAPMISRGRGDDSYMRRLGGSDYPRFHIYYQETADEVIFNLHLDQKRPSYPGARAHSGEYDGDLIEREAARIKLFIANPR